MSKLLSARLQGPLGTVRRAGAPAPRLLHRRFNRTQWRSTSRLPAPAAVAADGAAPAAAPGAGGGAPQPPRVWAHHSLRYSQPARGEGDDPKYYVKDAESDEPLEVLGHDYGYRSGSGRLYMEGYGKIPAPGITLAIENFKHEFRSLRRAFRYDEWQQFRRNDALLSKVWRFGTAPVVQALAALDKWLEDKGALAELTSASTEREVQGRDRQDALSTEVRHKLAGLQLSVQGVRDRETRREALGDRVAAPWFVRIPYYVLCWLLDVVYPNRPIQRFWLLEEVARLPYFSYISMLHLYETLGWWRAGADLRKVHFAEEWNEMHHLQIMESLGGDALWVDRFIASHASIVYFFVLVLLFFVDPKAAYTFSDLLESHAVDTYGEFVDANEEVLKSLPPPLVALEYYKGADLYMFDEFQTTERVTARRPACRNLYDVFANIRDDEGEHVSTMRACRDGNIFKGFQPPAQ